MEQDHYDRTLKTLSRFGIRVRSSRRINDTHSYFDLSNGEVLVFDGVFKYRGRIFTNLDTLCRRFDRIDWI